MRLWAAVLAGAVLAGCSGPSPVVEETAVAPAADGRVIVTVALRNRGAGEGQVSLTVTLKDRGTGAVVGRAERSVELRSREHVRIAIDVWPAGPGDFVAEAQARYPPE
jgi:hypothetical protein